MPDPPKRVIKIGGSLLDLPDLTERVQAWLSLQPPAHNLLIVGGGTEVDRLRQEYLDSAHDEVELHWRCVDWMDENAVRLPSRLPRFEVCDDLPQVAGKHSPKDWIFRVGKWLRSSEPSLPGTKLRTNWDVSSDSIAARLAICWPADELILLKSKDAPCKDLRSLTAAGYVDAMFPELAEGLPPCRFVNLR